MTKNKILLIVFAILLFAACKDEQAVIPTTFKIQSIVQIGIEEQTVTVPFDTDAKNVSARFTVENDWCDVKVENQNLVLSVKKNTTIAERNATLLITADDRVEMDNIKIIQNVKVNKLQVIDGEASSEQQGHEIKYSYDGLHNASHYHSNYAGNQLPITLTYTLEESSEAISALAYYPRNGNGNFGEISISVKAEGESDFKHVIDYDCKMKGTVSYIDFPEVIKNPREVRIVVSSGVGNHASCSEMEFLLGAY